MVTKVVPTEDLTSTHNTNQATALPLLAVISNNIPLPPRVATILSMAEPPADSLHTAALLVALVAHLNTVASSYMAVEMPLRCLMEAALRKGTVETRPTDRL